MIPDKPYPHPGTQPPEAYGVECKGCGELSGLIKGEWSEYAGRWYIRFQCPECGHTQSFFRSEPRKVKALGPTRKPYADDDE